MTQLLAEYKAKALSYKKQRIEVMQRIDDDPVLQTIFWQRCKRDVKLFTNLFVMGEDPRLEFPRFPFIAFDQQENFFNWLDGLQKSTFVNGKKKTKIGACVKSRDTGASVMCAIYLAHKFIFFDNFSGAIGSRKADLVYNDGNPDALFSKIVDIINNLPDWLRPDYQMKRMLLKNPGNGATIKGEAGDNIGRGGRSTVYFIDEAAFLERSQKVIAAVSRNTDFLVLFSTPNGRDNEFARMYLRNKVSTFKIHWTDDPRRDEEWYKEQCELFDSTTIAQELDCDFDAGKEGILINGKWAYSAVDFLKEHPEVDNPVDNTHNDIVAGYDPSGEGKDRSFLVIRKGIKVIYMQYWKKDSPQEVIQKCHEFNVKKLVIDAGYGQGILAILRAQREKIKFKYVPINFGGKPSEHFWTYEERSSRDKFINARAEMFWFLRDRFRRTYEMALGLREWEHYQLIDLPRPTQLAHDSTNNRHMQPVSYKADCLEILLNQAPILTWEYMETGKIKLVSKTKLEESPDALDALALCFYNVGKAKKANWSVY